MSADDDDDFAFAQSFEPTDDGERAAVDVLRLPTFEQLLCGHAYLNGSLRDDTRAWVLTTEDCWAKLDSALMPVLQKSVAAPLSENYRLAGQALVAATSHRPDDEEARDAFRPFYDGASLGCTTCALQVSRVAMLLTMRPGVAGDRRRALVRAALGWMLATKPYASSTLLGRQSRVPPRLRAQQLASVAASWLAEQPDTAGAGSSDLQKVTNTTGVIVVPNVGNPGTSSGERVKEELGPVVGSRLALTKVLNLGTVKANLIAEFPHFASVVDAMLSDVTAGPSVWIRPTLLFGKPGCGKSRFAVRFLEGLRLIPPALAGDSCASQSGAAVIR